VALEWGGVGRVGWGRVGWGGGCGGGGLESMRFLQGAVLPARNFRTKEYNIPQ
jgi:hypothetical protein